MGVSILVHWPGATEEDAAAHPGFFNDDLGWSTWLMNVLSDPAAVEIMKAIRCDALLSHTADGEADIDWTTPDELEQAAVNLLKLVDNCDPRAAKIIEYYQSHEEMGPPPEAFAQDLRDVAAIARYARAAGAQTVTLGYYW